MSQNATQLGKILMSDPVLSHFSIKLREDELAGRWELVGTVPTEGIKRRAGSVSRALVPPSVWLVNHIKVEPDDMTDVPDEELVAGVA